MRCAAVAAIGGGCCCTVAAAVMQRLQPHDFCAQPYHGSELKGVRKCLEVRQNLRQETTEISAVLHIRFPIPHAWDLQFAMLDKVLKQSPSSTSSEPGYLRLSRDRPAMHSGMHSRSLKPMIYIGTWHIRRGSPLGISCLFGLACSAMRTKPDTHRYVNREASACLTSRRRLVRRSAHMLRYTPLKMLTSRGRFVRRSAYMLECTRRRVGSCPNRSSASTSSVYFHSPPMCCAACVKGN